MCSETETKINPSQGCALKLLIQRCAVSEYLNYVLNFTDFGEFLNFSI